MEKCEVALDAIKCSEDKYNEIEVNLWKKRYLERKAIPSPWLNNKSEVIAFYNSFYALKELGVEKTWAVIEK